MGLEAVAKQLFFHFHSLCNGEADAVIDGFLAVAHCNGSVLGDLASQLQDILHQLSLRIHGVDQANAQSLVSLDVQGRVDQLLCHAHADQTNHALMPGIETMFLATSIKWSYLSSTIVKEAAHYGSNISKFVTPNVEAAVERKMNALREAGKL